MKKSYLVKVTIEGSLFSSQLIRLDDEGLRVLQRGILVAQGVDWKDTHWTKQEAIDQYIECLQNQGKNDLVSEAVETINDLDLHEFMVENALEESDDATYVSGDDVELSPETAAQYQADRKKDDI